MTVSELMAELAKFPQDTVVFSLDSEDGIQEVRIIRVEPMYEVITVHQGKDYGVPYWTEISHNRRVLREVQGVVIAQR